jgi:hypothetical protein
MRARRAARSSAVPGATRATITRGTGSSSSDSPLPSHGSSSLPDSSLVKGRTSTMPDWTRIAVTAAAVSRSMSRPAVGRIWMVISLATSDCHSAADALTSSTAPVVIEARKVMMATTATSARPAIEARGTMGERLRARAGTCGRSSPRSTSGVCSSVLLIDVQPSLMQHEAPRVVLVHQRDVVGRDDDRSARFVELDEEAQQPPSQRRIDIAGRLVREQQLRPSNAMSWPNRLTRPRVGRSDRNSSFSSEVLPAPEGPVRNWKEWAGIRKLRSRRISGPRPYRSPTFSNRTKLSSVGNLTHNKGFASVMVSDSLTVAL